MNKIEFYKEFKELCEYYNNKIYENKKILRLYYDVVKNKSLEEFKKQIDEFITDSKFMPRVVDFKTIKSKYTNYEQRVYPDGYLEKFYDNV